MDLTHFGHACVLVETHASGGNARLLFDPGAYSAGFENLTGLDAILITHEHQDHLDLDALAKLLNTNATAQVITDRSGAVRLREAGLAHRTVAPGDEVTVKTASVRVVGGEHAVIHAELPPALNNAYLVDDLLCHPGDAFPALPGPVRVLLLPVGGPWMKIGESIDYLRAVAPGVAVPIHQAGLADVHQHLHYHLLRTLGPEHTELRVLDPGATARL